MNDTQYASEFKQWGINRFAYVNEFKQIPNSHPPAFTISLCEPHGRKDNNQYVYYDLIIKELAPFALLNEYKSSIDNVDTKVSIQFNCYNTFPRAFIYKDPTGEMIMENGEPKLGASMRGYLSSIACLKIDNKVIYQYQDRKNNQVTPVTPVDTKPAAKPENLAQNA